METLKLSCLQKLFDEDIKRFISAEALLAKALERWNTVYTDMPLRLMVHGYQNTVAAHIEMLNKTANLEKITSEPISNPIMKAIVEDTDDKLSGCIYQEVKDACLVGALQDIIHLKISFYGRAASYAGVLGLKDSAEALHKAVVEEKGFDERLSHIGQHEVSVRAIEPLSQID